MDRAIICQILNHEMMLATGCTEPAAIALTAAVARKNLVGEPEHVKVLASVNIIKNAMSAGIPGTSYTGMNYAAALGAICGRVDRQLQVVDGARPEDIERAAALVKSGNVLMGRTDEPDKLYVEVELRNERHQARAIIRGAHTNVTLEEADYKLVSGSSRTREEQPGEIGPELISKTLSIKTIYDFVETIDREKDDLHMIELAIKVNSDIADIGEKGSYGLNIGRHIRASQESGMMSHDVVTDALAVTATAADARMAGANAPVVANSGSGNQGITATMPIVSAAKSLGLGEDCMFKAVTLSHLMAIHIHADFGLLSGLCGATIASTAAACGIVYLRGGSLKQIGFAVNNMLGNVTGMLCDGAKADCALKIVTCVFGAFHCAEMALRDECVSATDGIVETDPERTIENFVKLGNEGSPQMDDLILEMLLNKSE